MRSRSSMLLARNMPPGSRRVKDSPEPDVLILTLATYGIGAGSCACPDTAAPTDTSAATVVASQAAEAPMSGITGSPVKQFTVVLLEAPEKREQLALLRRCQSQPEFMPLHRACLLARREEPRGHESVVEARRVEHLLERRDGAVVQIASPIPHAFERGDLVGTRCPCASSRPGLDRCRRTRAPHRARKDGRLAARTPRRASVCCWYRAAACGRRRSLHARRSAALPEFGDRRHGGWRAAAARRDTARARRAGRPAPASARCAARR